MQKHFVTLVIIAMTVLATLAGGEYSEATLLGKKGGYRIKF